MLWYHGSNYSTYSLFASCFILYGPTALCSTHCSLTNRQNSEITKTALYLVVFSSCSKFLKPPLLSWCCFLNYILLRCSVLTSHGHCSIISFQQAHVGLHLLLQSVLVWQSSHPSPLHQLVSWFRKQLHSVSWLPWWNIRVPCLQLTVPHLSDQSRCLNSS